MNKKAYVEPELVYENFEMTQRIAACNVVLVNSQTYRDCDIDYDKSTSEGLGYMLLQNLLNIEVCQSLFQSTVMIGS